MVTVLTMITVDPDDPAFTNPTKFVGPVYSQARGRRPRREKAWAFRQDGAAWRRVVPSPEPQQIIEIEPITWLLERGSVVVCAGGGGIPTMRSATAAGELSGVEAVIDKDLASELLSEDVGADLFVMATDVDGVYLDWATPDQRRLGEVTPEDLLASSSRPDPWARRWTPRSASSRRPADGRPSAPSPTSPESSRAPQARTSSRGLGRAPRTLPKA